MQGTSTAESALVGIAKWYEPKTLFWFQQKSLFIKTHELSAWSAKICSLLWYVWVWVLHLRLVTGLVWCSHPKL